jgi:hypothetical protein
VPLATGNGISQIARWDMDHWGEYWRFTSSPPTSFLLRFFCIACHRAGAWECAHRMAFLHGLVSEELRQDELDYFDPDYEVLITIRAVKPLEAEARHLAQE